MHLPAGTTLGPYTLKTLIAAGGMGEVYRATDPRLGRDVAIKVLGADVGADPDRLRRFEQEARAAAALNHPNILTVHEIGEHAGVPYVVSELLEGETLRDKLARGKLPVRTAVRYARDILSGLAAAHERGIVHRDLKPENVFVTTDDRVKILDFGLAKLMEPAAAGAGPSLLATHTAQTLPGVVLGTIGYMSPEQVRGQTVDHRTDLFSVGAILYEMLSGERPFRGDSAADTISAILGGEPRELTSEGRAAVSPGLDRIVRHCLEKDPARRVQAARDLAFDLESIADLQVAPRTNRGRSRAWLWAAALATVCVGLGWVLGRMMTGPAAGAPLVERVARMTHDVGFSDWPSWSPDGRMFAFSSNRNGNFDVYVQRAEGGQEVVRVTENAGDNVQPAFSPDGASIAFVSTRSSRRKLTKIATFTGFDFRTYGGDVWVMAALGGQSRRLAEDGNFPVWHPNGRTLAYVGGNENQRTIYEVSIEGGPPHPLLSAAASKWEIVRLAYSPNGRWITFETADRHVMALPSTGGNATEWLRALVHAWAPDGRRVYYVGPEVAGATQIEAADVAEGPTGLTISGARVVGTNSGLLQQLAVAPDGRRLLAAQIEESLNLSRIPLTRAGDDVAGPEEALSTGQVRDRYPSASPDGRRILLGSNRIGQQELWVLDLASGNWRRVEMPRQAYDGVTGCWSHDSGRVLVFAFSAELNSLWNVAVDGSGADQLTPPGPGGPAISGGLFACAVSPDGRAVVYPFVVGGYAQLAVFDIASRQARTLTTSPSHKYEAAWSPDGRWIAFSANTSGSINVWRIPSGGGAEQQITTGVDRIRHLSYSPDGRWLYVQPNHRNIYRMPADGGPLRAVTHFPDSSSLFIEEPRTSPDGRYLVYSRGHGGSSIWMLTLNGR